MNILLNFCQLEITPATHKVFSLSCTS